MERTIGCSQQTRVIPRIGRVAAQLCWRATYSVLARPSGLSLTWNFMLDRSHIQQLQVSRKPWKSGRCLVFPKDYAAPTFYLSTETGQSEKEIHRAGRPILPVE